MGADPKIKNTVEGRTPHLYYTYYFARHRDLGGVTDMAGIGKVDASLFDDSDEDEWVGAGARADNETRV